MSTTSARDQLVRQLLARKLRTSSHEDIPRVPDGQRVRLTPAQAGIWFLTQLFPDSTEYNMFPTVELDYIPDDGVLRAALHTLVQRHDVFRLRIFEADGQPMMEDVGSLEPPITWYDLRDLPDDEVERQIQDIGNASARTLLRPDQPPLLRCSAVRKPGGRALLIIVSHHVICDGWSWSLLHEELSALLAGRKLPPPSEVRFIDYAAWLAGGVDERRMAGDLDYWTRKLGGELPILDLPKDRPRPAVSSRRGHALALASCPADMTDRLRRLADQEQTTLFVVLLAAYKVFLWRVTRQSDVVVGSFLAGRDHPVTEQLTGCFSKSVALRTDLEGVGSFREAIRRARTTVIEAQDHQSVSFEQVVAHLSTPRDLATHSVFQTSFAAWPADRSWEAGALFLGYGTAKWDMGLLMTESPRGLDGAIDCSADLFDRGTLERFSQVFTQLLTSVAERPDDPIGGHALVPAAEQQRILHGLNPYRRPDPGYRTLAAPFEEQARRTPSAVALVGDEGTLTYAELNQRANRLARFLRDAGAGPGRHVAVCMERGFGLVTALYAVAKAGAAYVPVEPQLPDARLAFMLEDTDPAVVLADATTRERVPEGRWRVMDAADDNSWAALPADDLPCDQPGQALGYLLFTSGSTGRPKAVAYPVDGAIAGLQWIQRHYPYGPGDTAILKTSYGFDVSVWELFWPLYHGARLVVCQPGGHLDPRYLAETIERHEVTTIFLAPAMMQAFLDELQPGRCPSLRTALCGGDSVSPRLRDSFHAKMDAELVNGYGPTEAGTVTYLSLEPSKGSPVVPLGRPADNFRFYVLDDHQQVLPIGVPGEAYIGAEVGLAHGYYQRPELTAQRFLPDPFGPPGARMYGTGDLCRYRPDGVLEHLGRIDRQVKIRGIRVELAEVEAVLCEHPAVAGAVVLPVEEAGPGLAAWVVAARGAVLDSGSVVEHARHLLPRHMVPEVVILVAEIPTNINGKVDRGFLVRARQEAEAPVRRRLEPPATPTETELADAFAEVLGVDEVGVTDSFFDLGGHSLLVFKLIGACERRLGIRPSVADVFGAPTVRDLAKQLTASAGPAVPQHPNLVPLRPAPAKPVLAFVHGGGGSALPFYEIARHLEPDYSTYALQWLPGTGADGGTEAAARPSIEDLAARYLPAVDLVRGLSPLILVGWSVGGCIAVEMAKLWEHRGTPPAALVLLDTWAPPGLFTSAIRDDIRSTLLRLDLMTLQAVERDLTPTEEEMAAIRQAFDESRNAFLRYRPAPCDREVTLLRAAEPLPGSTAGFPEVYRRPDLGWGAQLPRLTASAVAGNHFTMVDPANARSLAETLQAVVTATLSYAEI